MKNINNCAKIGNLQIKNIHDQDYIINLPISGDKSGYVGCLQFENTQEIINLIEYLLEFLDNNTLFLKQRFLQYKEEDTHEN